MRRFNPVTTMLVALSFGTAFTATQSSGVPSETRSVSTQLVPRSGGLVLAAAEVAGAAARNRPAAATIMRVRRMG